MIPGSSLAPYATPKYYVLDGHLPVPAELSRWAVWFNVNERQRIVAQTWLQTPKRGVYEVSTVFLGIDHNFGYMLTDDGQLDTRPSLFETMVFGHPDFDQRLRRYATWAEAETGHHRVVLGLLTVYPGAKVTQSAPRARPKFWQWWLDLLRRLFD